MIARSPLRSRSTTSRGHRSTRVNIAASGLEQSLHSDNTAKIMHHVDNPLQDVALARSLPFRQLEFSV